MTPLRYRRWKAPLCIVMLATMLTPGGASGQELGECLVEEWPGNRALSLRLEVVPGDELRLWVAVNSPSAPSDFAGVWIFDADYRLFDYKIAGSIAFGSGSRTTVEVPGAGTIVDDRSPPLDSGNATQLFLRTPGVYTIVLAGAADGPPGRTQFIIWSLTQECPPIARTMGDSFLYREYDFSGGARAMVEREVAFTHAKVATVVAGYRDRQVAGRLFGWFQAFEHGAARLGVDGPTGSTSRLGVPANEPGYLFHGESDGSYRFTLDLAPVGFVFLFGVDILPA